MTSAATIDGAGLRAQAEGLLPEITEIRRDLHAHPELGNTLPRTQERVLDELARIGLTGTPGRSVSGVTAVVEGDTDGPTILLRADMDALPMHEDADLPFKSTDDDAMHACGHDLHVSMLLGAARILQDRRRDLAGRVLLMFQPGEEGFHGARYMLEDGLLDVAGTVDRAFAIHVMTVAPSGFVALKQGSLMASSDTFEIVVRGRGGHASAPHHALDPIPIACEIVQGLQMMITRRIDAFDPAVITVAKITAGTTSNVIPETAHILGTIRAVSERTRATVHASLQRVAEQIAKAYEAVAEVELTFGYPVTVNDDHVASEVLRVTGDLLGADHAIRMKNPVMGAEDWSYVLQKVPGAMAFLGATPKGVDPFSAAPNHSNRVFFDEAAMENGMALYAAMALDHLAKR
jgi:amidohydrolase